MGKSEKMIDVINDLASKSDIFLQASLKGRLLSSYEDEDKIADFYHNMGVRGSDY